MKLFKFENFRLTISEEALLIKVFRVIWNRDRTIYKEKALLELGVIYFFCDPRSEYMYILNEQDRINLIKEHEGLSNKWKPDQQIIEAMDVYKVLVQTQSSLLLDDTRIAIDKVREFLRNVDMKEKDIKGKPIYTPQSITSTIKDIPDLIDKIGKAEKSISIEIEDNTRMRGSGIKKLYEDGFE